MTNDRVAHFLSTTHLLGSLSEESLSALAPHLRRLQFKSGEVVFAQDTAGDCMFWLTNGRLKLTTHSVDGHKHLYGMIEVGDHFGDVSAIDGGIRAVNAIADRRCEVLALDREHLLPAIAQSPETALKVMRHLCSHLRIAGTTIGNLALHNAETRIWGRLKLLAQRYARKESPNGSIRIEHGYSQQQLADSVGVTRVMVNRQMIQWRSVGLIEYGRGFVVVMDSEALEAHVRGRSTRFEEPGRQRISKPAHASPRRQASAGVAP